MKIGHYHLENKLILAPMAGISDRPFRELCKQFGAGLTVSEMVASNPALQLHKKTLLKANHEGESGLCSVQIVGTHPRQMAEAAISNVARGAKIIDINMGCPAKKVCSVAAGSALLKDPILVKQILESVVNAVPVPVTLKIRTGWDTQQRNALEIAKIAESSGIAALTIHGRTRACKFTGFAEYDTIKLVKQQVSIPVIANGDIDSPEKARHVLAYTQADALMIGRAAQGQPWIFRDINHFLKHGAVPNKPDIQSIHKTLTQHLEQLYSFYGTTTGVRMARKHIAWYFAQLGPLPSSIKKNLLLAEQPSLQQSLVSSTFNFFINEHAAIYGLREI
ncbi:MAG: tRNA dihydrouridine synthase DusB [Methylococcaceae bacterium]|jgi:tRNA-dihydrouridine synthase B